MGKSTTLSCGKILFLASYLRLTFRQQEHYNSDDNCLV